MPTNYERGAYEPADDIRVFDGGEDEYDAEGSRLPLLIVIALVVLAAFGGVVWLAYLRGVAQGHAEIPRVIAAEPGPAKVPPANAGGTPTPFTGLKIYQQPAPSNEDAEADSTPPPSQVVPAKPQASVATAAPPPPKPAAAAPTKPAATPPARNLAATAPASAPPTVLTVKPVPMRSTDVTPEKPAAVAPTVAPPAQSAGGLLQIGAYKSEAEANAAWETYKVKHSALLASATSDIKQVDLGAKGTWYRLRIASGDKGAAAALCAKLKAEGGACFPAK